jgi:hypothetical protein
MRHSIRTRLALLFIGLAVGPLLVVGGILAWQSFSTQQQQALHLQQQVAQRVAAEVAAFFNELENSLRLVCKVGGLRQLKKDQQASILSKLLSYQVFLEGLVLLDSRGKEQISLSRFNLPSGELGNRSKT